MSYKLFIKLRQDKNNDGMQMFKDKVVNLKLWIQNI